jgi:hypothetical protein
MAPNWNGPQPAPKALWALVHDYFPRARSLGIYNVRTVAGTSKLSFHAEGRALDIALYAVLSSEKLLGNQLFELLIRNARELGLDHVIWDRRIWSTAGGGPRLYLGKKQGPHTNHLHVAFTRPGSQQRAFPRTRAELRALSDSLNELDGGAY